MAKRTWSNRKERYARYLDMKNHKENTLWFESILEQMMERNLEMLFIQRRREETVACILNIGGEDEQYVCYDGTFERR